MTDKQDKDKPGQPGKMELREFEFAKCPKHGTVYPVGAVCPKCKAELES
jgi:hypothetical protein